MYVYNLSRTMAIAVSSRPLTALVRVSPLGICDRKNGTGIGFSQISSFPLSLIFHRSSPLGPLVAQLGDSLTPYT
jgi:hypothetical protein